MWVLDLADGTERLVADPRALEGAGDELPEAERDRRERARERAGAITAFASDRGLRTATFALGGRLFLTDLVAGGARELPAAGPAFDPHPDPDGRVVSYVRERELRAVEVSGRDRPLAGEEDPAVAWGRAEFVAAEEMGRRRGHWWAPDGSALVAARVDERAVPVRYIADPTHPSRPPRAVRYPAAGEPNADVSLHVLGLDGSRIEVRWDRERFCYLARLVWTEGAPLTLLVQDRRQRAFAVLEADPTTGETRTVREEEGPDWLDLVDGAPARLPDGRLVHVVEDRRADARRLAIDGQPVTPPDLHVRRVAGVVDGGVVVQASRLGEPTEAHVFLVGPDGRLRRLSAEPGVHDAPAVGGDVVVLLSVTDGPPVAQVLRAGDPVARIASRAEEPGFRPIVMLGATQRRRIPRALLLPSGYREGPLPVLLDPYGGPHGQRAWAAAFPHLESQWFADQGFAVLVADGRGTPAGGLSWEKAVRGDLIGPAVEDQVEALEDAAAAFPVLDRSRVAIRGWSFGGYLAAACVLRRPDVFHAAVAGAPFVEPRLYDTHYTERYLGLPDEDPGAYERSSLLPDAPKLERPLLLIHGLADDNVFAAHTLRLSRALLEAGRPHAVLPLPGVTHMASQEVVAEHLLLLQLDFLRRALGMAEERPTPGPGA
jgi:dipeptidyl-peptidase-4